MRAGRKGDRDEMVGWSHQLNGLELEQTLRNNKDKPVLQSMGLQRVGYHLVTEQPILTLDLSSLQKCINYEVPL